MLAFSFVLDAADVFLAGVSVPLRLQYFVYGTHQSRHVVKTL